MKRLERMRVTFAKKEATEKGAAQTLADSLQGVSLTFARKAGENEQLFGSVTSADITEALEAQGYHIDKRKITLADPIKLVGEYEIPVKLHREITTNVKVTVTKEA
jgi:large subunit ribosomal protein L9